LSPAEIARDGLLNIIAGSDTTSSVLAAALYYLIRNVIAYERLLAEVDGAFPSGEEPLEVAKSTGVAKLLHVGVRLDETNS
jgi:cytochrome P450